jgi:hypothetical protein
VLSFIHPLVYWGGGGGGGGAVKRLISSVVKNQEIIFILVFISVVEKINFVICKISNSALLISRSSFNSMQWCYFVTPPLELNEVYNLTLLELKGYFVVLNECKSYNNRVDVRGYKYVFG